MDNLDLLADFHKEAARQGPGSEAMTLRAIQLAELAATSPMKIADLGCGTGGSALVLATALKAHITAVDVLPQFLAVLEQRALAAGLAAQISTCAGSIETLPFEAGSYDVIWSEGAVYNIGFENGIASWKRYLKPGGVLVVSEITWTTASRPAAINIYWETAYPEIDLASAKMHVLEQQGYQPLGYFVLPESCWWENYYQPMQERFEHFLARHNHSEAAQAIVAEEKHEIELYRQYKQFYSYGMYIARNLG